MVFTLGRFKRACKGPGLIISMSLHPANRAVRICAPVDLEPCRARTWDLARTTSQEEVNAGDPLLSASWTRTWCHHPAFGDIQGLRPNQLAQNDRCARARQVTISTRWVAEAATSSTRISQEIPRTTSRPIYLEAPRSPKCRDQACRYRRRHGARHRLARPRRWRNTAAARISMSRAYPRQRKTRRCPPRMLGSAREPCNCCLLNTLYDIAGDKELDHRSPLPIDSGSGGIFGEISQHTRPVRSRGGEPGPASRPGLHLHPVAPHRVRASGPKGG